MQNQTLFEIVHICHNEPHSFIHDQNTTQFIFTNNKTCMRIFMLLFTMQQMYIVRHDHDDEAC
jgi:hypothetical protein